MHDEILTPVQTTLLPVVASFSKQFGLVGGTAVALHIGHRESIDFDLFTDTKFDTEKIKRILRKATVTDRVFRDETGQYTIVTQGVQMTFFHYPYTIEYSDHFNEGIRVPSLCTLAAMKLFALGRRAKWKDYVDLYFILKDHCALYDVIKKCKDMFGTEFNEKLVREQLSYFEDIDYSEAVIFKPGYETDKNIIKERLMEWSIA